MVNVTADLKKVLEPTWMENWYEALKEYTIPAEYFRVLDCDLVAMTQIIDGTYCFSSGFEKQLMRTISEVKQKYDCNFVFFRLGSRSPKDSRTFKMPISGVKDIFDQMADSMRFGEDVVMCQSENYLPYVFIRPWVDIKQRDEFRCFCKNGKLVGVSQYFYKEEYFYLNNMNDRSLIVMQAELLLQKILSKIELRDFIFDFVFRPEETPLLIELNPWSSWTDPCMFDFARDKFDGFEFRWVH